MTNEERKRYAYRCTEFGHVDCDYEFESDDEDELRVAARGHHDSAHRPEDWDPDAIDALILMKTVES